MATERRAEAVWRKDRQIWQLGVMKDGIRRQFSSKIPGRKGKHEAENLADAWLQSGTSDMKASAAFDAFLEYLKDNKSKSVYTQAEQLSKRYIRPFLASKRLSKVTPQLWQGCIDAGAKAGLSRRSCVNIRAQIVSFLKFCRMNRWQHERVEDGDLTIPYSAPAARKKHTLTDAELQTVFTDPNIVRYGKQIQSHYIHAFRFLILTGLRRGELCGLKQSDILGDTLTISRSINTHNEITHGKTDNARRTFNLTPSMLQTLEDQRSYLDSIGIHSCWIFPDRYGERPDPNQLYDHWRTYCARHNMRCSLHELRHTFISLTKSDLPMELLKAQVGHSTAMDTALIYGHEVDGDRTRAASIIEQTLSTHIKKETPQTGRLKKSTVIYCEITARNKKLTRLCEYIW